MKLNSRIHFSESEDRFSFKCLVPVMYGACQTALFYRRTDCSLYGELSQTGANKSLCVAGFEVLTAVATKSFIFCSITLCGPAEIQPTFQKKTSSLFAQFVACFMLVSCLAYSSILKMEPICSTEKSVYFHNHTNQCLITVVRLEPVMTIHTYP
jgi:hypothetical protein